MHVALYVHSLLPARGYGGTQRVVVWLARGLAELGHRVTVLALAGSRGLEAELAELDPKQLRSRDFDISPHVPRSADIVHAHTPLIRSPAQPCVFTLHGNLRHGVTPPPNAIFLSADHARRHGRIAFVHNGVDPADYLYQSTKESYDLFLGRLHSVKGYRWAIEGAKRCGKRLIIAGGWRPSLRPSLRFVGSVDGPRKAALLARAECLWMPALWDEPFGLTLVEALASGTPVLGTRRGSLPEVISPNVGALGDTLDELVGLRSTIGERRPEDCLSRVERWFNHRRMAEEYVRMYQHYLKTGSLPAGSGIDEPGQSSAATAGSSSRN
jgi:glycosyltransferase involved in cell wall biosynthesis